MTFVADAEGAFSPSMLQRLDLDAIYGKALRQARSRQDATGTARPLPDTCPFSLDDLLTPEPD